jgi:glycosyltransferase involved in cell wall biosynthesis
MALELPSLGAEHVPLPMHAKAPWSIWQNAGRLADLINTRGVDLIHARSRAPAWAAYWAAKRTGIPFVTTFHGTYNFATELKRRYNAVMAKGDRVIAISAFIAWHLRAHYALDGTRIRVVPRGVDLLRFDPRNIHHERWVGLAARWALPEGAPVILLPARLTRWKGHTVLLDALAKLGRSDICCLFVGEDQDNGGYRKELQRAIMQRGLGECVSVRDDCNDLPAAYMLADVVVSASTEPEAFGRVASEAQAMGVPLVATHHGGIPEQVLPGETAYLATPGNADDMAKGLAWALGLDTEARERLAEQARERARAYSTQTMCAGVLEVYDELLAADGADAARAA